MDTASMNETAATAPVPANVIPAELPHPVTSGGAFARGLRYMHHFEIELVSDGRRFWAAASEQGRNILNDISGEKQAEQDALEAHRQQSGVQQDSDPVKADQQNPGTAGMIGTADKPLAGSAGAGDAAGMGGNPAGFGQQSEEGLNKTGDVVQPGATGQANNLALVPGTLVPTEDVKPTIGNAGLNDPAKAGTDGEKPGSTTSLG